MTENCLRIDVTISIYIQYAVKLGFNIRDNEQFLKKYLFLIHFAAEMCGYFTFVSSSYISYSLRLGGRIDELNLCS